MPPFYTIDTGRTIAPVTVFVPDLIRRAFHCHGPTAEHEGHKDHKDHEEQYFSKMFFCDFVIFVTFVATRRAWQAVTHCQ
jgi:hypothetical protein